MIEAQGKKQLIANEDHGKQLVQSKNDFNIDRMTYHLKNKKRYLINL